MSDLIILRDFVFQVSKIINSLVDDNFDDVKGKVRDLSNKFSGLLRNFRGLIIEEFYELFFCESIFSHLLGHDVPSKVSNITCWDGSLLGIDLLSILENLGID